MITVIFPILFLLIRLYIWALIGAAVFSMLAAFNIIDTRNSVVWSIGEFLYRITDPVLRPIRNRLPRLSGIDISPMLAILVLQLLVAPLLARIYSAVLSGSWQPLVF